MDPLNVQTVGQREVLQRYGYKTREIATRDTHPPTQHGTRPQLTLAEKNERKVHAEAKRTERTNALQAAHDSVLEVAANLHNQFPDLSVDDWHGKLIQCSKKVVTKRKVNNWNVFISEKTKDRNADKFPLFTLPPGARKLRVGDIAAEYRPMWESLTEAEKEELVQEQRVVIEEQRKVQTFGGYNSAIASFHDTHTSLQDISDRITELHACTGVEVLLVSTRSKTSDFNQPYTYTTSSKFEEYFQFVSGCNLQNFALRSEAYHISGVQGVADKAEIIRLHTIAKMCYEGFDTRITAKYRVVTNNWPDGVRFIPPGEMGRTELTILYCAWSTEITTFRKLSDEEFKAWMQVRVSSPGDGMTHQTPNAETGNKDTATPPVTSANAPAHTPENSTASLTPVACSQSAVATSNPVVSVGSASSSSSSQDASFVPYIPPSSSAAAAAAPKKRKQRSDKGVPRGPRKKPHPELLSGTLRENLDPFSQYDDATLNDSLRAAGLFSLQNDTVEGKITLDTQIAAGGNNLSVGQRQILALARAIIRQSKLLILDEATSAIDYETDTIIQNSLRKELNKDVTLLTVAHRLQTIMDADKIMVLDSGRIVEFDKPSVLLQNEKGMLRALVDESEDKDKLYAMAAFQGTL
ncbi:hypothetical protein C8Q75DRAFT_896041 [Abortiporus biennis]|nr:hypothetical protein C8Q75DRAFT_896041 [Abortiporus biennis]